MGMEPAGHLNKSEFDTLASIQPSCSVIFIRFGSTVVPRMKDKPEHTFVCFFCVLFGSMLGAICNLIKHFVWKG